VLLNYAGRLVCVRERGDSTADLLSIELLDNDHRRRTSGTQHRNVITDRDAIEGFSLAYGASQDSDPHRGHRTVEEIRSQAVDVRTAIGGAR